MSVPVYHVQIGDGSQYQEKQPALPDIGEDVKAWRKAHRENRLPIMAGATGRASASVLWDDGIMMVRLELESRPVSHENAQPNILVGLTSHAWEALVASVASKRRELELRSFPDDGDSTEEIL